MNHPRIGIRPIIDGRCLGVREELEDQTQRMASSAARLISEALRYTDGEPVECVISPVTIGGGAEAAICAECFADKRVCATLSVTPCWCYGMETIDRDPQTLKAIWGFNGTERSGAVYLAAAMAAHTQLGLPAFSIYGREVQDKDDQNIPEDVKDKILRFARCAVAAGEMRGQSYVNVGAVSMGIAGSYGDIAFFQKYLGMHLEWVDMTEVLRRIHLEIYDREEYEKAIRWIKEYGRPGDDHNLSEKKHSEEQKSQDWEFTVKMAVILRDILKGNPKLRQMGYSEESLGKNAIAGGFQGQRAWTDWLPNADFPEAILNSGFDWNGKRQPLPFATENDTLNGVTMLLLHLLTNKSAIFADVRTYWSPQAVERVTGWVPDGEAAGGFIHLLNSGAAALDGTGAQRDESGRPVMKEWWNLTEQDIAGCMEATCWAPANLGYFRGGGFSSQYSTKGVMPVTMARLNLVDGLGPVLQIAEGTTVDLPESVNAQLLARTDPTWPSTWFVPRLTGAGAFRDVYSVMANWGANHGAFCYGHVGGELITLASMLKIPVSLHNVPEERIFRPHAWAAFGVDNPQAADFQACRCYKPL